MECFNYSLDRFFECINIWVDSCLMIRKSPYRKLCWKRKIGLSARHFLQAVLRPMSLLLRHSSRTPLWSAWGRLAELLGAPSAEPPYLRHVLPCHSHSLRPLPP